ncbi:MAG: PIN domain-containing protein [bacterium]|nr:PIN domain-containing protein [bacterium]
MPLLKLPSQGAEVDIPRESVILDSCVLASAFFPGDQWHDHAEDFLAQERAYVVPYVVVAEAWGVLVRAKKERHEYGLRMLRWATRSPNVVLVPGWRELLQTSRDFCDALKIDFVDAFLMGLASRISDVFRGGRRAIIATYDTRDFFISQKSFRFEYLDLRDGVGH